MLVDTGSVHHYLPRTTAQDLFSEETLSQKYTQIHFASNHASATEKSEASFQLVSSPAPSDPVYLEFAGSKLKWPVRLDSPLDNEYASIRSAASGGRAVLGMPFISSLKGVIFDFTKGKERVGFISWNELNYEEPLSDKPRERLIQFIVGASLGLGIVGGWRWYEGSLF